MDAVRRAVSILLLTAIASWGCAASAPRPSEPATPPAAAETTATTVRGTTLRVGLPAARRPNLLFQCDSLAKDATRGVWIGSQGAHAPIAYRWVRERRPALDAPAPRDPGASPTDTLLLIPFDESTDEEIALERGELDAAVFWPGELSARMRNDARWRDPAMTMLPTGVVACVAAPGDTLGILADDMLALDREAFAGDLLPWSELAPGARAGAPAKYAVDPALPGARLLERVLARVAKPGASRRVRLVYLDYPILSETGAGPDIEPPTWSEPGLTPVFAIRCPVLVSAHAQEAFRALGRDAFSEFLTCAAGRTRR
jgi:hypothetical protein